MQALSLRNVSKIISDFDPRYLREITEFRIQAQEGLQQLSMEASFKYSPLGKESVEEIVHMYFDGCRFDLDKGLDLYWVLHFDKIVFLDIRSDGWSGIGWEVRGEDEDGHACFKFYCAEINFTVLSTSS